MARRFAAAISQAPGLRGTPLFGSLPELDSLAVVQLVYALEEQFGITVEPDEITGELFETLGNLASYVESKIRS